MKLKTKTTDTWKAPKSSQHLVNDPIIDQINIFWGNTCAMVLNYLRLSFDVVVNLWKYFLNTNKCVQMGFMRWDP